jgi:hypothetical protein
MWLQEEDYSEWVTGLHWIYVHGKGLSKFKVSANKVCSEILQ